ncbi:hypothetical protein Veis_0118 [Verminephrobacter eiseniae EF01-2]|uniref:Uncharacterized protein n=1 Tax=Verminephrobacter eiseniae (strain EF01-2) TaxID=391735 RepID=A1WE54_VEREI|nr:hypothetical protein Veis_0118 [Verminephrobacter eiseniae EF01-2]
MTNPDTIEAGRHRPVSCHRSNVVGCAQPSERSARRIACPYRAVLASDATPRCASMASADRQMIRDATLAARASPSAQTTQRIPTCAQGAARLPAPSAWKRQTTGASGRIRARRDGCALRV